MFSSMIQEPQIKPCPAPKGFSAAGTIEWVRVLPYQPAFIKRKKRTGARWQGVKYERKGHEHFHQLLGEYYFAEAWFQFREEGRGLRYCQTDGLYINPVQGRIIIFEFKYQHTSDAWWQLRRLYSPVLKKLFGSTWEYSVCEVVKWFDPATAFPEKVRMCAHPLDVGPRDFGLHIWKP